jgi:hypothetical protein
MSFGGPPPNMLPPSGPFEASVATVASSPYTIAVAIFLLNMGGRFLPFELTKGQEAILNQPIFRRLIIFVIFFVATRNLIIALWMSLLSILFIGYLFNENSSLYIFGKRATGKKTPGDTVALTQEEQQILKSLIDKSERVKRANEPVQEAKSSSNLHAQYKRVLESLWQS